MNHVTAQMHHKRAHHAAFHQHSIGAPLSNPPWKRCPEFTREPQVRDCDAAGRIGVIVPRVVGAARGPSTLRTHLLGRGIFLQRTLEVCSGELKIAQHAVGRGAPLIRLAHQRVVRLLHQKLRQPQRLVAVLDRLPPDAHPYCQSEESRNLNKGGR